MAGPGTPNVDVHVDVHVDVNIDVHVGIVSFNTADLLDRCLAALGEALAGLAATVTVVDNASGDGSADIAARRPGIRVVRNERNVGYARAMNQALGSAAAGVLVALNPDSVPGPGSLARLVEALASQAKAGLVVPRLANEDGSLQHSVFRFPSVAHALVTGLWPMPWRGGAVGRRWWLVGHAPHDRPVSIDWALGAVHVIRTAALADPTHPYSERSFMYAEDLEMCWSMRRRGWEVRLEPAAQVVHVGNVAAGALWGPQERESRVLDENYAWYVAARGRARARAWALANCAGSAAKLAAFRGIGDRAGAARSRHLLMAHAAHLADPQRRATPASPVR